MKHLHSVITLLCVLLAVGLLACGGNSGADSPPIEPEQEVVVAAPTEGDPANGEVLFNQATMPNSNALGCAACHSIEPGVTMVGPSLAGVADVASERVEGLSTEEYLRQSIINPNEYIVEGFNQGLKPLVYDDVLTEQEINDLIAYMLTLEE